MPWRDDEQDDGVPDEWPTADDVEQFEEGDSYCPHCGAEVWDDVALCPSCRNAIDMPSVRPPIERWWRGRWTVVIVAAVLLGLCGLGLINLF